MSQEIEIIMALQKEIGSSRLHIYRKGQLIGTILQDKVNVWLPRLPEPANPPSFPTPDAAIKWLMEQSQ